MGSLELWSSFGRGIARGVATSVLLLAAGCSGLTREEAAEAVEEARLYSEAVTMIGTTVEMSENFSIGEAVSVSAQNLRDFYESQLPCAEVALEENTVTVAYGATGDDCEHRGMTFTGTHSVTVEVNGDNEVEVHHEWIELENGTMRVSGTADVTWTGGDDPSRRIVHDLAWERIEDGREAEGRGDRVQQPLDGDIANGLTVEGDAVWRGESGSWDLTITDVEARWVDPVPQNGKYILGTPFGRELTLEFSRSSPTSVDVVVKSGRRQFDFEVTTPR